MGGGSSSSTQTNEWWNLPPRGRGKGNNRKEDGDEEERDEDVLEGGEEGDDAAPAAMPAVAAEVTAATAAHIVMSLFEWGGGGGGGGGGGEPGARDDDGDDDWLTAAPMANGAGTLREPAIYVIHRARAAATSCLALLADQTSAVAAAAATRNDWRLGWRHDVHSAAIRALAATACTAACDAGGARLPATAPATEPLAAAVSALSPAAVASARDDPGAAALRRALCAWHPDIQAGAAIVGGGGSGGVNAVAGAGGVSVIMGLLAVVARADGRGAAVLGTRPCPSPPPTRAQVCAALIASTRLIKDMSRGRIGGVGNRMMAAIPSGAGAGADTRGGGGSGALVPLMPAPAAWEVGAAAATAVCHLLKDYLAHSSEGGSETMDALSVMEGGGTGTGTGTGTGSGSGSGNAVESSTSLASASSASASASLASSSQIETLLTAVHEAFDIAGPDAAAAAAADPELLASLRSVVVVAPIPTRTAAALAAGPILAAALAAADAATADATADATSDADAAANTPSPLTLKEAKSIMTLMSISRDARTARAGAELLLAHSVVPGARRARAHVHTFQGRLFTDVFSRLKA